MAKSEKVTPIREKWPGRPRMDEHRDIPTALLDAAEAGLLEKGYSELKYRDIASSAGANGAMIKYYFDGKDGLFSALIENAMKKISADLDRLEKSPVAASGSPIRPLIALLSEHYCSYAPLYKIVLDELRNHNSSIFKDYMQRGAKTFLLVTRIIQKLVAFGVYKPQTDVRNAAFMITCWICTPVSMSPVLGAMGFSLSELKSDTWVDIICSVLDREFGNADVAGARSPS